MDIKELKDKNLKKDKGNTITESDYVLRTKNKEDAAKNTVIMEDSSKYADEIAAARATLSGDERAKMKAELLAEIKAELAAAAKKDSKETK